MILPLERLMEKELSRMMNAPTVEETEGGDVEGTQERGRSLLAMNKLLRAVASHDRPVVMMLDDIQWATACDLGKWRGMILDEMNEGILFLGVCRDDVDSTSPLSSFLRDLEGKDYVPIVNIPIKSLKRVDIEEMIQDRFFMPSEQSKSLTTFVYQNSGGGMHYWLLKHSKC